MSVIGSLKYEHITELTPEIMHELIEKIVIHAPDKSSGHRTQENEIHYRFDVAITTAVADSIKYDKKERLRNRLGYATSSSNHKTFFTSTCLSAEGLCGHRLRPSLLLKGRSFCIVSDPDLN